MDNCHASGQSAGTDGVRLSRVFTRIIWLCMLPLFIFGSILTILQIRHIHQEQFAKASLLAQDVIFDIDSAITSRIKALNMLATSPFVDDAANWHLLYREAQSFQESFGTHVVITDGNTQPQLLLSTRRPFGSKLPAVKDSNGRLAGPIAMRTGRPAVSDLFANPIDNQPLIGIAVPVMRQGTAKFIILTVLSPEFFQEQLDKISLPPGWHVGLKDAQGQTIARLNVASGAESASQVSVRSSITNWQAEVEILPAAQRAPLLSAGLALAAILAGATLTGFLSGKWAERRVGTAIASLAAADSPETAAHDGIREIAAARRLIRQEAEKRLAVENALRETMMEYEAMFERSVVGKAQADPATGRFLKVNRAFADMLGYSAKELCRLTALEITHPEDRQGETAFPADIDRWQDEKRYLKKDGTAIWVSVSENLLRAEDNEHNRTIAVIQDISERKKAEEALRRSEERFRLALRNAPVSVAAQDRNLRYIWAYNQRTARPEELIGRADSDIFTPEEARHFTASKTRVLHEDVELREQIWLDRPGGRKYLDIIWEPIHDPSGKVIGVASATVDLTSLKLAEESLRKSEERLRASLAEKVVLLKEIHHRVKNNMQVISSLVELQADQVDDETMRGFFRDVVARVRSMAMVHEKLYHSQDLAHVNFADYAESLLNDLWRAQGPAATGVALNMALEPVLLSVTEAVPCGLMLNELFTNALKHAFAGRRSGEVHVSLRREQSTVVLAVKDDGIGLPAGLDLTRARSLGLRLIQMLARQLQAAVEVRNDTGTTFIITFKVPDL